MAIKDPAIAKAIGQNALNYFHDESRKFPDYPFKDDPTSGSLFSYLDKSNPQFLIELGNAVNEAGISADRLESAMRAAADEAEGKTDTASLSVMFDKLASETTSIFNADFFKSVVTSTALAPGKALTEAGKGLFGTARKSLLLYAGLGGLGLILASVIKSKAEASLHRANPYRSKPVRSHYGNKGELQSIVVSREVAPHEKEAKEIAAEVGAHRLDLVDKTGRSYRFRQESPRKFRSFRTKHIPKLGVTLIYGIPGKRK